MTSLQDIKEKINPRNTFFVLVAAIFVVTNLGSFAIGRLSVQSRALNDREVVKGVFIDTSASEPYFEQEEARETAVKTIMASVNGTRYYPKGCTAGSNIKEENQIWFVNANEAKMAGYTLAKACE